MHLSLFKAKEKVVKLLLENGADISARSAAGCTPLYYASTDGKFSIKTHFEHVFSRISERNFALWKPYIETNDFYFNSEVK